MEQLKVKYFHQRTGDIKCAGNIIWAERDRGSAYYRVSAYAGRNGKFPPNHPAAPNQPVFGRESSQGGDSPEMIAFRSRGYWASCFPEGDGITLDSGDKTPEQVIRDIEEVFGWKVERKG